MSRFDSECEVKIMRDTLLQNQMRFAIERNEFSLVMQPIIQLDAGPYCLEGECLLRWKNATFGHVSPADFIALAEDNGFIIPLGSWVIEQSCNELAQFIARGAPENFRLHINVSPLQILEPDFSERVLQCIQVNGLKAENICIEITERVFISDVSQVVAQLTRLSESGVAISIDDFGTCYSSLSWLHALPFNEVKIDRQFVGQMLNNKRSEHIVSSIISLSHKLGASLVAEGVECSRMVNKLRELGCDKAQGYHFAKPCRFNSWKVKGGYFPLSALPIAC